MTLFTQGILYCHLCRAVFKHTRMHRCSVHPICRQSHWCNLGHNDSMATVLSPYMTSVVMHGPERRPCEYVLWERGLVCSKWTAPQQAGACNRNAKMCPKPRLCHLRSAGPEAHSWEWAALSAEMQVKKSWTPFFFYKCAAWNWMVLWHHAVVCVCENMNVFPCVGLPLRIEGTSSK